MNRGISTPILLVIILVIAGLWLYGSGRLQTAALRRPADVRVVRNFAECEQYGYQVSGTYPRRCVASNGQIFVESSAAYANYDNDPRAYYIDSQRGYGGYGEYYVPGSAGVTLTKPRATASSSHYYQPRPSGSSNSGGSATTTTYTYTDPNTYPGGGNMPVPSPQPGCFVSGCSGQICSDQPGQISTCEYRPEYACYRNARCERQSNGQCGWTPTSQLMACLSNSAY